MVACAEDEERKQRTKRRKHGLSGKPLKILESLVKFCLQFYFKMYFDIKVRHLIIDAPHHVLTSFSEPSLER